jgi:hypothetical protein
LSSAHELRELLGDVRLPFDLAGADLARAEQAAVVRQLDDYVLPRLRDIDAPALAVVGGSTGSGKSTLVNSLLEAEVTVPGVLRPTTLAPVLVHHPSAERWFRDDRILPDLARVTGGPAHGATEIRLVASDRLPPTLALVDAPDIDSVVDENRVLAAELLDAADLWVFVTTASRYADAVPWSFLRNAARRGVEVAVVMNRVPPGAAEEVSTHLADMLVHERLAAAPVFVLEEQPLEHGRLPASAVAAVGHWAHALASDQDARRELIRRTLTGTIDDLATRVEVIRDVLRAQDEAVAHLATKADERYADAREQLVEDVRDGTVMRGEVLARWQDLVGTGDLLRLLQSSIGRWRDRLTAAVTGRPTASERFEGAVESGVETLVRSRVAGAVEEIAAEWKPHPAGAWVLAHAHTDLRVPSPDLGERSARMVRDWQAALLDLLRAEGGSRRSTAKVLSYGVNGIALVLMVAVFAQTGGLTGAEVAIAGGSSVAGQKVLEALLGDQAVRRLSLTARQDLDRRIAELIEAEAERHRSALRALELDPDIAARLEATTRHLRHQVAAG